MWRSVLEDRDGCADGPTDSEASAVFEGHKHDVYSVVCREGGKSIISAGYDRMVREWDVPTERQVCARQTCCAIFYDEWQVKQMTGHESAVTCVCSNDGSGSFVCSGSRDASIRCVAWTLDFARG